MFSSIVRRVSISPRARLALVTFVLVGVVLFIGLSLELKPASAAAGAVNITSLGTPFAQNFDTLISTGSATWTNNSTIPGWYHARTGTGTTIVVDTGTSTTGNLFSYGSTASTDRALGSIGSGNATAGNFSGVSV